MVARSEPTSCRSKGSEPRCQKRECVRLRNRRHRRNHDIPVDGDHPRRTREIGDRETSGPENRVVHASRKQLCSGGVEQCKSCRRLEDEATVELARVEEQIAQ